MRLSRQHSAFTTLSASALLIAVLAAPYVFSRSSQASTQAQQTLRVDVNLVNVFVTVQDQNNQFVTNLSRDDFKVYEDDVLQDIRIFEKQDEVQSAIGIMMDTSGSMVDILPLMVRGIREFTSKLPRLDDFFVASFGTSVDLVQDFSESPENLQAAMARLRPRGASVMYDGLIAGMDKLAEVDHERKALIVFTDGNDNGSKTTHGEVIQEAQRSATLLYFVAIGSPILVDSHTLDDLAKVSGGRTLYIPKTSPASAVLEDVHAELAHQYYLGYYAVPSAGFHRIRVEVPDSSYKVRTKTGYRSR